MGHLYAIRGAYFQQLRMLMDLGDYVGTVFLAAPIIGAVIWIASQGIGAIPSPYLSVGIFLTVVWVLILFRIGFSLAMEFFLGTLDHTLISPTPLFGIMIGKVAAFITIAIPPGAVSSALALLVSQESIDVVSPGLTAVSAGFAVLGAVAVTYTLAPLFLLSRNAGYFSAPFAHLGMVLGAFLYPVSLLPTGVEVVARFMPTPWAMDGVMRSIESGGMSWRYAGDWGMALLVSLAYLGLTYLLFRKVETRIRVTGSLSPF